MGMFDEVIVPCPTCGEVEAFQSKSGPCLLECHSLSACPEDILADVNRHAPYLCGACSTAFSVDISTRQSVISMLEDLVS